MPENNKEYSKKVSEYKDGHREGFWEGVLVTMGALVTAFTAIIVKSKTFK